MDFIASLFQHDMFLAVVSYLSIGLICLACFFYRERKWERDLAQYKIKVKPADPPKMQSAEIYPFIRDAGKASSNAPVLENEMQVVAGESMEPESQQAAPVLLSQTAGSN